MPRRKRNLPSRGLKWTFMADGEVSRVTLGEGLVIFGTDAEEDGTVYALDADLGMVAWEAPEPMGMSSAPCLAGSRVAIGSWDGRVYCFELDSGRLVWRQELEGAVVRRLAFTGERLLAVDHAGYLYGISLKTGGRLWSFTNIREHLSAPTHHFGEVIVGGWGLFGVGAQGGKRRWKVAVKGRVKARPVVHEGRVYYASWYLHAMDLSTRQEQWVFTPDSHLVTAPVVDRDTVYVGTGRGRLYAVDRERGALRWHFLAGGRIVASPVVLEREVIVADASGDVWGLDRESGEPRWSFRCEAPISGGPVLSGRTLFVGTRGRALHALDLDTEVPRQQLAGLRLDPSQRLERRRKARDVRPRRLSPPSEVEPVDDDQISAAPLLGARPPLPSGSWWRRFTWALARPEPVGRLMANHDRLEVTGQSLLERVEIGWDQRFVVLLSTWLLDDVHAELNVTLRHTGVQARGAAVQFRVVLPQRRVSGELPLKEERFPYLEADPFEAIWAQLAFRAEVWGLRVGRWVAPATPAASRTGSPRT